MSQIHPSEGKRTSNTDKNLNHVDIASVESVEVSTTATIASSIQSTDNGKMFKCEMSGFIM